MKVCHLITRLIIGGAQENTLFTCYGLAKKGHRVTLLTGPAIGPEGSLLKDAEDHGLDVVIIRGLRRRIDPFSDFLSFLSIIRFLRREKPDILHTHSAKAGILGRLAVVLLRSRPAVVHTIHGLPFHPYQNRILNLAYILAEKAAALFTDAYISVADTMTVNSLSRGIGRKNRYTTIYSAFPVDDFVRAARNRQAARAKYGFRDDEVVIGKIARLFHLKGHQFLLQAFVPVQREFPGARLFFIGDGILRPQLEATAAELGLADSVVFAGLLPPAEIPGALAAMDFLVHASLREGLPKSVAQALAAGVPVAAFDVDGTGELVRNGVTGYLVPAGDAEALAQAMVNGLRDYRRSREMAAAGQKFVLENFAVEKMVTAIEAVYYRVINRNNGTVSS